jgi:hypothetical protein
MGATVIAQIATPSAVDAFIRADGPLTGYAGGLHRKEAFLTLEGAISASVPASAAPLQGILV